MNNFNKEAIHSLGVLWDPYQKVHVTDAPLRRKDMSTGLPFIPPQEKIPTAVFNGPPLFLGQKDIGVEMLFLPRFQTTRQREGQVDIADGILALTICAGNSLVTTNVTFIPQEAIVGEQSIFTGKFPEDMRTLVKGDTIHVGFTVAGLDGNPYPAYAHARRNNARIVFSEQEVITAFGMGKNAMPVQ